MKNRTILVKIPQGLDRQKAYRARRGIGSMSDLAPVVPGAALITMAGGVRAASRVSGLSTDTVMATRKGAGSLRSYMKLAQALGMAVKVEAGKSDRWKTLHSSDYMCWETPPAIWMGVLERLGLERFDLDPCSPRVDGPVAALRHFTEEEDGLARDWAGHVWVNPPYGRALGIWIDKMIAEAARGEVKTIVALVPARTGTAWWHRAVASGVRVEFLRGRVRFWKDGREGEAAPFDSAVLFWGQYDSVIAQQGSDPLRP